MNSKTSSLERQTGVADPSIATLEELSDQLPDGLEEESRIYKHLAFLAVTALILLIASNPDWLKAQANEIYQLFTTSDFARVMSQYLAR